MAGNPESILYDINGNPLAIQVGVATPSNTPALMIAGSDGVNSRYILVDSSGNQVIVGSGTAGTPTGGVISIQGVSGGTVIPISITGTNTVTANQGTANTLANGWPVELTDGTNLLGTNSHPLRIDPTGTTTQPVSGTISISGTVGVTQSTSPWVSNISQFGGNNVVTGTGASGVGIPRVTVANDSNILATQSGSWTVSGSGNFTVIQPTASSLNATIIGLGSAGSPSGGILSTQVPDTTNSGALNGLNAAVSITLSGTQGSGMQLAAGTLQGTIVPEISYDSGTTWVGSFFVDPTTSNVVSSIVFGSNNTATARTIVVPAGASNVRVRVSLFTSGTANCSIRSSFIVEPPNLFSGAAGSIAPPSIVQVGGNDGTNLRAIITDASGHPIIVGDGIAGTPAGGVVSIQGVAGGTSVPISGTITANIGSTGTLALDTTVSGLQVSQGSTTSGQKGDLILGAVTTSAPSYSTAQTSPLSLTTSGLLRVDGSGVTQPVSGTVTSNQGTAASLANAWSAKITDATNGPVAVKAASTAAIATDPALVVAISPNNSISIAGSADTTSSGNLNALNATVQLAVTGENNAGMQLSAGTLVGTIVTEVSLDGGTTWVANFFDDPTTGNKISSIVFGSSNTATTRSFAGVGGASHVRVRVSAFTSGTAVCSLRASIMQNPSLLSEGAAGSSLPPEMLQIGGSVSTSAPSYSNATMNALSLNTSGGLRIDGSGVTQPVSGTVTSNQGTANTLANKWPVQITDGTNTMPTGDTVGRAIFEKITDGTNTAAVKAASTPAAATDPSLVVAISPNNSITVAPSSGVPNITASGTLGALNATVQVSLSGQRGASMQLLSGTLVGTIVPELSTDGGTTWNNTYFYDCESSIYAPNIAFPSNNTSITRNIVIISGASHIRIRVSAYGSGSATCNVRSSSTNNDRIFRTSISGRSLNDSSKSILLNDSSSTLNTALWTLTKLGTGTATGLVLTNDTTSTHYVIITSNHQFYSTPSDPLIVCFTASMFAATNGIIDFGIGSPVSLPSAGLQFGAYFQIDGSGNITANLAYTGQAKFANMGTYSASSFFYKWCIEIIDYGVKFFIEDFNGNVLSNVILSSPDGNGLASPYPLLGFGTFPIYARVYNIGTAGSTPEFNGTAISVYRLDTGTNKDWPSQMAATSRWFNINPTTFAQNAQLAAGAAPATKTPASTTSAYTTLGGEFVLQNTASSENLLGVFGYQIPSPFTFYLTNILFPPPVVTTALGATVEIQEWCLMVASSANPSTATGFRNSLGLYSAAASAVAGTVFNGQTINPTFTTPIVVYPGQFLLVLVKIISGSTTGIYRGSILLNGYFE